MKDGEVKALYRPRRNDVAIMAANGLDIVSSAMTLAQARQLHDSLGEALRLAGCRARPLTAVEGASQ
jgi:hypothetical protein